MLSQWLVNRFSTGRSSFSGKNLSPYVLLVTMMGAEGAALLFPLASTAIIGLAIDFNAQFVVFIAIEETYAETP